MMPWCQHPSVLGMCPSMPKFTFLICKMKFNLQDFCGLLKKTFMCLFVGVGGTLALHGMSIYRMDDSMCELVLSYHVGSANWAKVVRLGSKCLYLLRHLLAFYGNLIIKQEALFWCWTKDNTAKFGTLILAYGGLRQEDCHESEAILGYIASSRPA